jgi:hypothetical protein
MLALAREAAGDAVEEGAAKSGRFENWLGRSNKGSFGAQRNTPSN